MAKRVVTAVVSPSLGLYYDRDDIVIPVRGLKDGNNFRIQEGHLTNALMGWRRFSQNWKLNEGALTIINFLPREFAEQLVFLTATDGYKYNTASDTVSYITPRYEVGTASNSGSTVTGVGTAWDVNVSTGDQIAFSVDGEVNPNPSGNDSFTKVLLHFSGADASTTIIDSNAGATAHAWTAAGNAQIDTADSKFGGASLLCDGTGDWVTTPDSADFTLGSGNFTIDLWFKISGGDGTLRNLAGQNDVGGTAAASAWLLTRTAGNKLSFQLSNGAAFTTITGTTNYTTAALPGWHHLEIDRNGTALTMYVDGVVEASGSFSGAVQDSASVLGVGVTGASAANGWFGWLDEFRLSIGTARHTAAFTAPTEAYSTVWFPIANVGGATTLTVTGSPGTIAAGPYTIRKLFHASKTNDWDFDVFVRDTVSGHDQLIVSNGVDFVHSWDGSATQMVSQSAMAFKCKRVLAYKNMMLYANITNQGGASKPMDMINSAIGAPFLAGATGTGLSEQFTCHDGQDEISAARKLGDMAVMYSERHCVPAQFVGDPLVFVFREAAIDIGPIATKAIADFGDYHEFLGTDAAYGFDGVTLTDKNNHIGREMIRSLDPVRKKATFLHFNEERGEVYWCIPRASDTGAGTVANQANRTWTEHYLELYPAVPGIGIPFSQRDFPFSCAGYYKNTSQQVWNTDTLTWAASPTQWNDQSNQNQFPLVVTGDDSGFIYIINTVQQGNGANLNSFVHTGRRATQDDGRGRGLVKRIYFYLAAGMTELKITLYGSDTAHGSSAAMSSFNADITQPAESHFCSPFRVTRYFELEFGAPNGGAWELAGWDYDVVPGGAR